MSEWTPEDFNRRSYYVESPALDKAKRVELKVIVDGKVYVHTMAREPGIVGFVSKPDEQGFHIEIVEATGVRYTEHVRPDGGSTPPVADWQKAALDL
jgi:hypothetical protein